MEKQRIKLVRFCESVLQVKEEMADKSFLREVPRLIVKELKRPEDEASTFSAQVVESRRKMEKQSEIGKEVEFGEFTQFFKGSGFLFVNINF